MPYARLQYNGDNQYTTKDKRNLLLTQEAINKINGLTPSGWWDVIIPVVSELPANPSEWQLVIHEVSNNVSLKIYYAQQWRIVAVLVWGAPLE